MNRNYARARYWTTRIDNREQGFSCLRLHRDELGRAEVAAEVVFWDAAGQYFLETFNGDVPVAIIEELLAEARAVIKVG